MSDPINPTDAPPWPVITRDGPVLGSQAADNAAWDAVRAAVLAGDEVDPAAADEVTARVVPVLARLVDSVRPAAAGDGPVLDEEACPHDSLSGDEGPVAALGREPRRWRCDSCGKIIRDEVHDEARRVLAVEICHSFHDLRPERQPCIYCAQLVRLHLAPHVAALLVQARADGAAEERKRIIKMLLAVDGTEWALAGQYAGVEAARIIGGES